MRIPREYLALAGAVAAVVLLAAGCGDDDSAPAEPVQDVSGSQSQAALSKNAFIAQGDAICGEANVALSSLETGTAGGDPEYQATQELEITRSALESLQSLSPPNESRSVLDRFLSALEDQVDALSRKQTAVEAGDDPGLADAEVSSAASSAQAAAQDYGFEDCANASQAPPAGGATAVPPVTTPTTPTVPATPTPPATGDPGAGGGTGIGGTGGGTGGGSGGGSGGGGTGGTGGTGGGVSP